jgi:5-methylcytosine-specific restriction enzyme A
MSSWAGSDRRSRLPRNWASIRRRILARDGHKCQWRDYNGWCGEPATDVDHVKAGDNHSDDNLRSLCTWHHGKKSAREGAAAAAARRQTLSERFRRDEGHPGSL